MFWPRIGVRENPIKKHKFWCHKNAKPLKESADICWNWNIYTSPTFSAEFSFLSSGPSPQLLHFAAARDFPFSASFMHVGKYIDSILHILLAAEKKFSRKGVKGKSSLTWISMLAGAAKEPNRKENYAYIYVTGTVGCVCSFSSEDWLLSVEGKKNGE